jgi:lipase
VTPQAGFVPYVARLGRGPRRVLALHCTLAFSGAWAGLARQVEQELTLVAPDMPNHGRSPDLDPQSSFADTAYAGALACLDAPMDVMGHSFGAVIALRIAVERPEHVRSLTLIEPVLMAMVKSDAPEAYADLLAMESDFSTKLAVGDWAEGARSFNRTWGDGKRWAELSRRARDAMVRAIQVLPGARGIVYDDSANLIPRLDGVEVPCLLVRGADSPAVIRIVNSGIGNRLPDAREEIIDGAGHMAPVTHPERVARVFMAFLRTVPQGPSLASEM